MEDYHLNQIRKETTNEESDDEEYINEERKIKRVFNENYLKILKKREIASLNKMKKETIQKYNKKIKKNNEIEIKTPKNLAECIEEELPFLLL